MKIIPDSDDGYRQLIASIIWLSVYDSCSAPVRTTSKAKWYRPTAHAQSAIAFLFGDNCLSSFERYIECLEMDAESFRNKLLRAMYAQEGLRHLPYAGLPDNAAKSFRFNHTHWLVNEKGENLDFEIYD